MLLSLFILSALNAQPQDYSVRPKTPMTRASTMPESPALMKSLGDAAEFVVRWQPPRNAAEWRSRRPEAERAFRRAIGLERFPERTPLKPRIVSRHDFGDYTVENVVFESRPGFPVTANLYRPKGEGKRPAILSPIGHFLGAGRRATQVQERCMGLVKMGYIVLAYDAIGQGERMVAGNIHHEAGYALLPLGETIAGWMVWDSMRAIDYLLSLKDVDAERLGMTGNSGGGLNTLFTAALDPRVKAAAVAGYTFQFNNWLKYGGAHCSCNHLPGVFRGMEWFEVAGLIAPRPLLLLQGEYDTIFPIAGARRSARDTEAVYRAVDRPGLAWFREVAGQPHAYTAPFREHMYGFFTRYLRGGPGDPVPEKGVTALDENDPRLLCDPRGEFMPKAPTVIDLARTSAAAALRDLDAKPPETIRKWVADLVAPDETPGYLAPERGTRTKIAGGTLDKLSFVSEDGAYIPALLWLPEKRGSNARDVLIVDSRGKSSVAVSGLIEPLLVEGSAVLAVDLRGRGEMLDFHRPSYDINFRLVANQVLSGRPLAGRRAFDLKRAIDFMQLRGLAQSGVTLVGIEEDALPALLTAASDQRVAAVALARWFHSFVSGMRARVPRNLPNAWNDPQLRGRVDAGDWEIDFGSVIPSALLNTDVAGIADLMGPRNVLFCEARDERAADPYRRRWIRHPEWLTYRPAAALDANLLLEWLRKTQ